MKMFATIIQVLFVVSTILFIYNAIIWLLTPFQEIQTLRLLLDFLWLGSFSVFVATSGLIAGGIGLFNFLLWGIASAIDKSKEINLKHVFIPISYGIIWIVVIFNTVQ